jgi:tetratricopeptide (TPR) repeat protein
MIVRLTSLISLSIFLALQSANAQTGGSLGPDPVTPAEIAAVKAANDAYQVAAVDVDDGKFTVAESAANRAIALGSVKANYLLSAALVGQGKTKEAMAVYASLYASNESSPRELLPYSLLLLKSGQWDQAVDVYHRTLPRVGTFLYNGANLLTADSYFSYGDPQPVDLETDIHIAMGFTNVYSTGFSPGRYFPDKDLEQYKDALTLEPDSPLANLAYAYGLRELGRNAEAVADYQSVASKFTGDIKASALQELSDAPMRATALTMK